jgi:hypothetical protein
MTLFPFTVGDQPWLLPTSLLRYLCHVPRSIHQQSGPINVLVCCTTHDQSLLFACHHVPMPMHGWSVFSLHRIYTCNLLHPVRPIYVLTKKQVLLRPSCNRVSSFADSDNCGPAHSSTTFLAQRPSAKISANVHP